MDSDTGVVVAIIAGVVTVVMVLVRIVEHLVFSKSNRNSKSGNGSEMISLRRDIEQMRECAESQEDMIRALGHNMLLLQEQSRTTQDQIKALTASVSDLTSTMRSWISEDKGRREALRDRGDTGQFRVAGG